MAPWLIAVGVPLVQVAVLLAVPAGARVTVSALMAAATMAALTGIMIRLRRPRGYAHVAAAARAVAGVRDPDVPSPAMRLARALAERGVPAVWIAEHCGLPVALAELVLAEAQREHGQDAAGGRPPTAPHS